jgi:hypothetical protein
MFCYVLLWDIPQKCFWDKTAVNRGFLVEHRCVIENTGLNKKRDFLGSNRGL